MTARVVVYHSYYGCETGCCGHTVALDDEHDKFVFDHISDPPTGNWSTTEHGPASVIAFVRRALEATYGVEHLADVDWSRCLVCDDNDHAVFVGGKDPPY